VLVTDKERDNVQKECEKFSDFLMEMGCESTRIVVSLSVKSAETESYSTGRGNWFTQIGSVRNWVTEQDNAQLAGNFRSGGE
jgi:hypothetical protein